MKKILSVIAIATVLLTGCASTKAVKGSGIKGKAAKIKKADVTIIDYQGSSFGSEIPQWVVELGNGNYSAEFLQKIMPGLKGKKAFVTLARGDNLDFTKQWTDLVDIELQVGDEMQRVVGKAVSAVQQGRASQSGSSKEPTQLDQELNMYKQAISSVELNGLEKIASYWIQKRVKRSRKDIEVYYEYYTVWAMDKNYYDAQIQNALETIDDNTDDGKELKNALSAKLADMMISSNDETLSF